MRCIRLTQQALSYFLILQIGVISSTVSGSDFSNLQAVYEASKQAPLTQLDHQLLPEFQQRSLHFAPSCSDATFVRRVHLDITGRLPTAEYALTFTQDTSADKRARLIDQLLESEDYAVYWAMKWSDLLRVKSEFPINLWPNAAQAYHQYIYQSLLNNKPYDVFSRELITSSGSNFRTPEVNFYRALQGKDAPALAQAVALTFMGVRLENWPTSERERMERFFSRVAFKPTAEWKEEIVHIDPSIFAPLHLVSPDGKLEWNMPASGDPRTYFAEWLITDQNPWFAKNQVNRQWAWLMGRGIIHEPDDIRPDNPATHPRLLSYLEQEFIGSDYDMKHVFRLILNSRCYQQTARMDTNPDLSTAYFAVYTPQRLEAEVLSDVLCELTDTNEKYVSMIPEPFTYIPDDTRTIAIADGSISSSFLQLFGRSERDTGYFAERNSATNEKQALHLLNSSHISKKLFKSKWVRKLTRRSITRKQLAPVYLAFYSRVPTQSEVEIIADYYEHAGRKPIEAAQDTLWAIVNSKEFIFNH